MCKIEPYRTGYRLSRDFEKQFLRCVGGDAERYVVKMYELGLNRTMQGEIKRENWC